MSRVDVTFLIPCLNEEKTIKIVIDEIFNYYSNKEINFEILVADNGSTDSSKEISIEAGAKVIDVKERGYGSALLNGIKSANGSIVVMGDADGSYKFGEAEPMIEKIIGGADLVMGNRFGGRIEKNAMPFLHKYLGNPILSLLGRIIYKNRVSDFHSGLRAFNKKRILELDLKSKGMEFASELIIASSLKNYKIEQVPINLYKDLRERKPHLRTWSDGWRHLKLLLVFKPKWIFIPFIILTFAILTLVFIFLVLNSINLGNIEFSLRSALLSYTFSTINIFLIWSLLLSRIFFTRQIKINLEKITKINLILIALSLVLLIKEFYLWFQLDFKNFWDLSSIGFFIFSNFLFLISSISLLFIILIRIFIKIREKS